MELNSLLILLEAAEYLERRDREAEHGYASVLPFASDYSRKKTKAAPLARRAPSSRCQSRRCRSELDPSRAPAAPPGSSAGRPASPVPRRRTARPGRGLSWLPHGLFNFFVLPVVFLPAATTCAAMALGEGCCAQALCSFVCCSGSGCVRAGGCLTGTAPAPAWELLQPCALPALLRSSRAASVSRRCPAGPAWPRGTADAGSSRIA